MSVTWDVHGYILLLLLFELALGQKEVLAMFDFSIGNDVSINDTKILTERIQRTI